MLATKFSNCNKCAVHQFSSDAFFVQLSSCSDKIPSKKHLNKTIKNCAKCPFPQYLHLSSTVIFTDVRAAVISLNKHNIHKSKKIPN